MGGCGNSGGSVIVAMLPGELLTVFDLYKRLFDFVCGQI